MPELPEVETVMTGLKPAFEGYRFTHVETRRKDLRIPFPKGFAKRLTGRRVVRMWRRGENTSWPISTMARRSSSTSA